MNVWWIRWMQPFEPLFLLKIFSQYCSWGLSSAGKELTSTPQAWALSCAGTYIKQVAAIREEWNADYILSTSLPAGMVKDTILFQRDPKRSGCRYSLIVAKGTVFVKHFLLLPDTVALLYRDQVHLLCMQSSYTKVLSAIQERRLERTRLQVGGQGRKARKQRVH